MSQATAQNASEARGWLARWSAAPLYLRILGALVLGVVTGLLLGERAAGLALPSQLILRLLGALAPPLILLAVIHVLMTAEIQGRLAGRLAGLLLLNTLVAIIIGLAVANVVRPGRWSRLEAPREPSLAELEQDPDSRRVLQLIEKHGFKPAAERPKDPVTQFLDNVPRSLLGPLGDKGSVISVIFIAVAFGIAFRRMRHRPLNTLGNLIELLLEALITVLHWIIDLVPLGVFGIVASIVGREGFQPVAALGAFIVAVLLALALQASYYLARVRFGCWVRPVDLLRGGRDALVMAFSTASSTATMPVTYACLRERVGLREESASLGALVGSNFNNDGTALYEAMSALFVSQMLGIDLTLPQQFMVVLTSIVASVGAAGIPEAGLVTMTLVFTAVGLPTSYIALLLTVDWFLDRCRTAINVMGDMNVSCLLEGRRRSAE
jgi:Na+/H+-dicarboxylate symporter